MPLKSDLMLELGFTDDEFEAILSHSPAMDWIVDQPGILIAKCDDVGLTVNISGIDKTLSDAGKAIDMGKREVLRRWLSIYRSDGIAPPDREVLHLTMPEERDIP